MPRIRFAMFFLIAPLVAATVPADAATAPPVTEWRWIATKSAHLVDCPKPVGQWDSIQPFKGVRSGSTLGEICAFTFTGSRPVLASDLAALQALITNGDVREIERDLMALGSSGSAFDETLWQPLSDYFLDQAGRGKPPEVPGFTPVRLAILDTHPTAEVFPLGLPANSEHGETLIAMAERLLCGVEPSVSNHNCVAQVTSRLAMSYVHYDPNDPNLSERDLVRGGFVGTLVELAEAIEAEVSAWEANGPTGQGLVLNLSVGWNPAFGGLEPEVEDMPLPVRLVHEAIVDAGCRGALVVAATGNRSGGPNSGTGPMLPAAWANRPMPLRDTCPAVAGVVPGFNVSLEGGNRPMLYAVGGVQGDGAPLSNSRLGSVAERMALGDHGVVPGVEPEWPTAILTGSSVSTLVASAAASAAWYYDPNSKADAVMRMVDKGADRLPMRADFCFGDEPLCPESRLVSVCGAAEAACNAAGVCPHFSCSEWDPSPPDLSENRQALMPTHQRSLSQITAPHPKGADCQPLRAHFDPADGPSLDPCPDRQYTSIEATPWVHPQPGTHTCPPCRIHRDGQQLVIEIDDQVNGTLSQPTLEMCGNTYSLGNIPLEPGEVTVVDDVDATGCSEATVSFTVTTANNSSYSSINSALFIN